MAHAEAFSKAAQGAIMYCGAQRTHQHTLTVSANTLKASEQSAVGFMI